MRAIFNLSHDHDSFNCLAACKEFRLRQHWWTTTTSITPFATSLTLCLDAHRTLVGIGISLGLRAWSANTNDGVRWIIWTRFGAICTRSATATANRALARVILRFGRLRSLRLLRICVFVAIDPVRTTTASATTATATATARTIVVAISIGLRTNDGCVIRGVIISLGRRALARAWGSSRRWLKQDRRNSRGSGIRRS